MENTFKTLKVWMQLPYEATHTPFPQNLRGGNEKSQYGIHILTTVVYWRSKIFELRHENKINDTNPINDKPSYMITL